ncbi:MAG: hypothetical protein SGI72_10600 [Planctomycetota bacterium]|nr:hypothetical protein [Planctomycetota bacterium]
MERRVESALLVGVDGGATEVKAHAIVEVDGALTTSHAHAGFRYERVDGFAPVDLSRQLDERARGEVRCCALEHAQGERWIEAFANAIESVAACASTAQLQVGICAPGLKTLDARGLAVVKNGPRIVDFVDRLEARLVRTGLVLARPIPELVGDGVACGLGEQASAQGGLRAVSNAYYVGGGTGIAECFVLEGRVVSLDEVADIARKAWSMTSSLGHDFESSVSARGLNARFVELGGRADVMPETTLANRDDAAWPTKHASGDDRVAARTDESAAARAFAECAAMLAELVNLRVEEMRRARGITLERVVVGQRLGALFAEPRMRSYLLEPAERVCSIPIHPSTLRASPAIGAARWASLQDSRGATHAG